MAILRILGATLLFFIIRQFLKLVASAANKQMPHQSSNTTDDHGFYSNTKKSNQHPKNENVIDATFTRKE